MLLVDTSVLVATADRNDPNHQACLALLEGHEGPLITTAMVIAEASYLINRQLGSRGEVALYTSVLDGSLRVEPLRIEDWARIHQLVTTYADLSLGGTDASLVAIAERLGTDRVATLDHRHFAVVRPAHIDAFTLLP